MMMDGGTAVPGTEPGANDAVSPVSSSAVQNDTGQLMAELEAARAQLQRLEAELQYERHRNDSLEGRIESQLRPANEELRQLREKVSRLESELAAREASIPPHLRHLRPEEVQQVDANTLDIQARVAKGVAEAVVKSRPELEEARRAAELAKAAAAKAEQLEQTARLQQFWAAVERAVPGAQMINATDPGWRAFLMTVDPLSGKLRRDIGVAAIAAGDVGRVATLFGEYLMQRGTSSLQAVTATAGVQPVAQPQPQPQPSPQPQPQPAAPAPTTGRPDPLQGAQGGKPVYTKAQMDRVFLDVARGRISGDEAKRWVAEFTAAVREGRVVEG